MTDISQVVLLPRLWAHLRQVSPDVRIEIIPLSSDTVRMLEAGEADLALGFMPQLDAGVASQFRQTSQEVLCEDHCRYFAAFNAIYSCLFSLFRRDSSI